jgi:hypothetical protein
MSAAGVETMAAAAAKSDWQSEWEKTLVAATKEGQVTVYGPPAISHQHAIGAFQSSFPKIKPNTEGVRVTHWSFVCIDSRPEPISRVPSVGKK